MERNKSRKIALLIEGARRVGKSYIAKEFGEKEYKSCLLVDFSLVSKDNLDVFENDIINFDI